MSRFNIKTLPDGRMEVTGRFNSSEKYALHYRLVDQQSVFYHWLRANKLVITGSITGYGIAASATVVRSDPSVDLIPIEQFEVEEEMLG